MVLLSTHPYIHVPQAASFITLLSETRTNNYFQGEASTVLNFYKHFTIWKPPSNLILMPATKRGIIFTIIKMWKLKFRNMKQIGRWIISRKVGTGTQAFKVQHPLFPLPIKHKLTDGSLRSQQWAVPNSVWITYDFSLPPHLRGQHSWLYQFRAPTAQTLQVREPHTQEQLTQLPSHPGKEFVTHPAASEWVSESRSVTLCNRIDYKTHGILQARILEWIAFPFSMGSSQPRDWT